MVNVLTIMKYRIERARQTIEEVQTHIENKFWRLAKHFTELFDKRHKGDYNDFFDYEEEIVLRLYPLSKELIKKIEELLTE